MLLTLASIIPFVVGGLPPQQMADVVAERLSRLDRLVAEVSAELYFDARLEDPLDRSAWVGPYDPGDGIQRTLRIVRPGALEESFVGDVPAPIVTSFAPGRAVRRVTDNDREGRSVYSVHEDAMTSATYTSVPLLQVFDIQVHESFLPGLNTLRLLRDYPAQLLRDDGDVSTYGVSIEVDEFGPWVEHYEFDLNRRGTPMRFQLTKQALDGSGFYFERIVFTLATMEVNGAELITEAVAATRNSAGPETYAIHHMEVCSAAVDDTLTQEAVQLGPAQRNARIFIKHPDLSEEMQVYDEAGNLIADATGGLGQPWMRKAVVPLAAVCGLLTASVLALRSRRLLVTSPARR